jgi:lactate dehydrogenase-like 2-hydroxyacid dehydrogenase
MSRPTLVVTTRFLDGVEARIARDFNVRRPPGETLFTQEKLLLAAVGADAIFITLFDKLDAAFFERVAPSVKVIATYSVGYDHIDLDAAAKRKIAVAHTPGAGTDGTADIAILLMLGTSRRGLGSRDATQPGPAGLVLPAVHRKLESSSPARVFRDRPSEKRLG